MFITGPEVIKTVTHEQADLETLGGAFVHNTVSGVAHFAAENEGRSVGVNATVAELSAIQ